MNLGKKMVKRERARKKVRVRRKMSRRTGVRKRRILKREANSSKIRIRNHKMIALMRMEIKMKKDKTKKKN